MKIDYKELVAALRYCNVCTSDGCDKCPYVHKNNECDNLLNLAADAIEKLTKTDNLKN